MEFVTEGWENGPSTKRELKGPARLKKDSIFFTAFGIVYFVFFVVWESAVALGAFLRKLVARPGPKSLKGRVCLVSGSGRGLGRQFCLALAREGAVIACVDINETTNRQTVTMVKELGAKAALYTVNLAIRKDVEALVSRIEKELGPVYLLINNAAIIYTMSNIDEEFVRASFNVNVLAPIWLITAVLPTMKMRNEGHIVNISSIATKMVTPPLNIYGSTKSAMTYFADCVRSDLLIAGKNNIFVTNVHPSIINTSEDYMRCIPVKINVVVEMNEVVKATMNAIYYNYDEVVVPSIMKYPLMLIKQMMPSRTGTKLMQLIFDKWNPPNEEQTKLLPWGSVIKQCSLIDNKKDNRNER